MSLITVSTVLLIAISLKTVATVNAIRWMHDHGERFNLARTRRESALGRPLNRFEVEVSAPNPRPIDQTLCRAVAVASSAPTHSAGKDLAFDSHQVIDEPGTLIQADQSAAMFGDGSCDQSVVDLSAEYPTCRHVCQEVAVTRFG